MRTPILLSFAALFAVSSAHASEAGQINISGQINIGTEGVSKGISETDGNGQIVGALTASHKAFFVGVRAKNTTGSDGTDGQTQWFAGAKGDIAGFKASLQLLYKTNNNARPGTDDDFYEWQSDISRTFDKTTVKYTAVYSPDSSGSTEEAWWHDVSVAQKLTDKWTLSGCVGIRRLSPERDYTGYNLGATYAVTKQTGLDVRYYDTDKHEYGKRFGDRVVLTLTQKF
ncbi:TorF family putative porin [Asticcacaulis machinosus]|uniref:TorF family putative porin n=1 Tax=Asticcacaulis machinosus TaxID=2984211 RepID=A0ABT5HK75_9CAUL|nr:TorF family putative porin [Asticcacaulis machinosus]MDC7676014.1 TorF family putative porin [Asticcacaulis machinosus]